MEYPLEPAVGILIGVLVLCVCIVGMALLAAGGRTKHRKKEGI